MKDYKEEIFEILTDIIKDETIEGFKIYDICIDKEKLQYIDNNFVSYKILNNNILLRYFVMKKVDDAIEIRIINNDILKNIQEKFDNVKYKETEGYARISISDINEIKKISNEIKEIFKYLFLQYIQTEESFGCCSKYVQCSDNLACIQKDLRIRLGCLYKKNLENNRIFYGKNKNI